MAISCWQISRASVRQVLDSFCRISPREDSSHKAGHLQVGSRRHLGPKHILAPFHRTYGPFAQILWRVLLSPVAHTVHGQTMPGHSANTWQLRTRRDPLRFLGWLGLQSHGQTLRDLRNISQRENQKSRDRWAACKAVYQVALGRNSGHLLISVPEEING
jgi:hypothetical protein